jgi:hypothetical protein
MHDSLKCYLDFKKGEAVSEISIKPAGGAIEVARSVEVKGHHGKGYHFRHYFTRW